MLEIVDLCFSYGARRVLDGISANVSRGHILGIVGPNGTGKTTLIKCVANLIRPAKGNILIDGADPRSFDPRQLARCLAYVPQHARSRFPVTVFEAVLMGRRPYVHWRPSEHDLKRTAEIIGELSLRELATRDLDQLSGGQAQKVILARALAQEPDYLLLDEPTSNLDLYHQLEVMEIIRRLVDLKAMGAVIAVHDLNLAARYCDTVMMLKDSKVFASGEPSRVIVPENIREVYTVDADVRHDNGRIHVQPLRCVNGSKGRCSACESGIDP